MTITANSGGPHRSASLPIAKTNASTTPTNKIGSNVYILIR
jgi:hypothetical protein